MTELQNTYEEAVENNHELLTHGDQLYTVEYIGWLLKNRRGDLL